MVDRASDRTGQEQKERKREQKERKREKEGETGQEIDGIDLGGILPDPHGRGGAKIDFKRGYEAGPRGERGSKGS